MYCGIFQDFQVLEKATGPESARDLLNSSKK